MENSKVYTTKANATRAAKAAIKKAGIDGDITTTPVEGGFTFQIEVQVPSNDFLRVSEIPTPCSVVWDIASSMEGAKRKDVIAECTKQGIAFYTARTQYQLWKQAGKVSEKNEDK